MSSTEPLCNGSSAWKRKNASYFMTLYSARQTEIGGQFTRAIIDSDSILLNHAWCQKNKKVF